ncbi:putative PurR-regulated permease PerM [Novosphingobium sp. PhB55]|uniref:AI-2E family transporter n=1 Tax=Novosphingobium sp. PhB55 TaxID=2485106 RepID=UPI0010DB7251|nr:AI-2E family transporter [Novosphingobium sp. PhB55]TDW61527.1 putative PurR-regulated permease PerM [Novosphingobium sp. PhB55]
MEPAQASEDPRYWTLSRIAVAAVMVIAIFGVGLLLVRLSSFLMLVFAAVILGVVFDAIARAICSFLPIGRALSLGIAVILLLGVFTSALILFGAQLTSQFDAIKQSLPDGLEQLQAFLSRIGLDHAANGILEQGKGSLSAAASKIGTYMIAIGNGVTNFVLVFFAAIFLAADPAVYRRGFLLLMPDRAAQVADEGLKDAGRGLTGWMKGQAVSSVVVAILTSAGLTLLGVPSAGGLGVIAGLLDVIPMIGPVISGVPAVLLAFTQSPATALWTVLLFVVIQQLQGNFLQPMIQKQAVDVPPAVLLFTVVAAGTLFGALGVLLAAPLTIAVFVLVKRIYVKTLLGKDVKI